MVVALLPKIWSDFVQAGRIIRYWNTEDEKRYFQLRFSDSNFGDKTEIF